MYMGNNYANNTILIVNLRRQIGDWRKWKHFTWTFCRPCRPRSWLNSISSHEVNYCIENVRYTHMYHIAAYMTHSQ